MNWLFCDGFANENGSGIESENGVLAGLAAMIGMSLLLGSFQKANRRILGKVVRSGSKKLTNVRFLEGLAILTRECFRTTTGVAFRSFRAVAAVLTRAQGAGVN